MVIDIDASDYDVVESLKERFSEVELGLLEAMLDRSITKNSWYKLQLLLNKVLDEIFSKNIIFRV